MTKLNGETEYRNCKNQCRYIRIVELDYIIYISTDED